MKGKSHLTHGETSAGRSFPAAETVAVLGAGGRWVSQWRGTSPRAGTAVRARSRTRAKADPRHGDEDFSATYLTSAPEYA